MRAVELRGLGLRVLHQEDGRAAGVRGLPAKSPRTEDRICWSSFLVVHMVSISVSKCKTRQIAVPSAAHIGVHRCKT